MRLRVRLLLVLSIVALGGLWLWQAASAGPRDGVDGRWVEPQREDLQLTMPVVGELRAQHSKQLGPPQSSTLWDFKISFMAPEGAEVEVGDPVLRFDTSELLRQLEGAVAKMEAAEVTLEKERSDLNRELRAEKLSFSEAQARQRKAALKIDVPEGLVADNEALAAKVDLTLAETEISYLSKRLEHITHGIEARLHFLEEDRRKAEARVQELERVIAAMTVKAPTAGTVIYLASWQGTKKKVGDSCWKAEKVLELPNLDRMEADGEVDESVVGRLAEGMAVSLRLDSYPDEEYRGVVRRISKTVQQRSRSDRRKVVRMKIDLNESDRLRMRPGMRFRGHIEVGRVERALVIPVGAVRPSPTGPELRAKGSFGSRWQSVRLGQQSDGLVEVLEGLEEGDRVWVPAGS